MRTFLRWAARNAMVSRLARATARVRPVVSIVMPVHDVERYLSTCLDSVLAQDFEAWELIAVDDGSTDGSARILDDYAARDRRIRVLHQSNTGQGPARNRAIAMTRGTYLIFVDSDDRVPPGSFRFLVGRLRHSGSDLAVGGVRRITRDDSYRPSWTVVVHEHDRVGVSIDDFPDVMADVVAHHRIIRRDFWNDRIGGFPAGVYEDHEPMVACYLRARRFDVLSRVVYEWRLREEGTSTGQQKHRLDNLRQRIAVKARAREMVWAEASPAVRDAWVGRVLNIDFPPYVEQAMGADTEYRRALEEALAAYIGLASPNALSHVRVRQKVRTYLASRGEWEALAAADRVFSEQGSIPPTVVRGPSVFLAASPTAVTGVDLPDEMMELGRSESRLQVCLAGCDLVSPRRLRITGWAVIRAVDLSVRTPSLQLSLVDDQGGRRMELAVDPVAMAAATEWVNWSHGAFDRGGFTADIDLDRLASESPRATLWRLRARLEVDGLAREGGVHHAVAGSSASRAALVGRSIKLAGVVAEPSFDGEHGFQVTMRDRSRRPWRRLRR